MTKNTMQFLYGDRELLLKVADIFSAPVDVIVNPASSDLMHAKGLAAQINERGGEVVRRECAQFIKEHGSLESGMVALTSAGDLPYQAILHAVVPQMGEGDEQTKITQAVSSLKLCSMHGWASIAFPDMNTGNSDLPVEVLAKGFFHAITSFWDARLDEPPNKIVICLGKATFRPFFDAFRGASMMPGEGENNQSFIAEEVSETQTGIVNLDENEISQLDDEVNDWFK